MKKILVLIGLTIVLLTGCTSAETVSYNISRDSDEFKVKRRITYDYEFIFRPEAIIPIEIKTQVGD